MQEIEDQLESEERQIYKRNQTSKPQNAQTSQLIGKSRVKVGDRINAKILKKDGIKITVRLQTDYKEDIVFERPHYSEKVGTEVELKVMDTDNIGRVIKVVP